MDTFWQDLRYGARLLARFPGVTAAALLALALGTGVNTALFSIVNTVLLQPLPFPDADELIQVWRAELPRLQFGSACIPAMSIGARATAPSKSSVHMRPPR